MWYISELNCLTKTPYFLATLMPLLANYMPIRGLLMQILHIPMPIPAITMPGIPLLMVSSTSTVPILALYQISIALVIPLLCQTIPCIFQTWARHAIVWKSLTISIPCIGVIVPIHRLTMPRQQPLSVRFTVLCIHFPPTHVLSVLKFGHFP